MSVARVWQFVVCSLGAAAPASTAAWARQRDYTPSIVAVTVANPRFHGEPNTMMYTVTAEADDMFDNARHDAVIGFATNGTGPRGDPATNCPARTDYTWSPVVQRFAPGHRERSWTLYNFQPDTPYYYAIRTGTPGNYKYACGALETAAAPVPTVPASLLALNLQVDNSSGAYFTKYVLFDTDDCSENGNHLIAIDADTGKIVWYLDIPALVGAAKARVGGFRFQEAGDGYLTSDRIIASYSEGDHRSYLMELELDGTVIAQKDFGLLDSGEDGHLCDGTERRSTGPCPHHDAFKSDLTGETYALVSENSDLTIAGNGTWTAARCTNPTYRFVGDGWATLSDDYTTLSTDYLIDDLGYDPATLAGPHAPAGCTTASGWDRTLGDVFGWLDWLHTNSIAGSPDGQSLDISLREWDQIIRVRADGSSTSPEWTLASDPSYSDFGALELGPDVVTGEAAFGGQHDVHAIDESTYLLFDNDGNREDDTEDEVSRVLSIAFDTTTWSAQIEKSWAVVDNDPTSPTPLHCLTEGSGQLVPGTDGNNVLALCSEQLVIAELDDPSGAASSAALYISVPHPPAEVCGETDGSWRVDIPGWFRAYPLESLGDF